MTLRELKTGILDKTLSAKLLILVCKDGDFLANQYIDAICGLRHSEKAFISSLAETEDSALALVFDYENRVNVLKTDEFAEYSDDYSRFKNCIVVCDRIDPKINDLTSEYAVDMPKLVDWQIKDYIKTSCPELNEQYVDWLYKNAGGNVWRISNELDKIKLFPKEERATIAEGLRFDPGTDLYALPIFDLTNALIANDRRAVLDYEWHREACKMDPLAIASLLLSNFKKALLINWGSGLTAQEIGVSPAQYSYLSRHSALPEKFLVKAIRFLSEIDYRLKSGNLEMNDQEMTDYIICRILALHSN